MPDRLAWDWLGSIADVTSLVMLPVTIYTAWKVQSLKKRLVANARLDPLLDKIRKTLGGLYDLEERYPKEQAGVHSDLRLCLARLYRYEKQFPDDVREIVQKLKSLEKRLSCDHTADEDWAGDRLRIVRDIIEEMSVLVDLLGESRESRQLGGHDA